MCEIIEIRVLNLGNADSIIVVLRKGIEVMIILIDTGRPSHLKAILKDLNEVLTKYRKPGPDLIICTHYDYDHIGSLEEIVFRYKLYVKEVWMHKTSRLIEIANKLELSDDASSLILPDEEAIELKVEGSGIINYDDDDVQDVLQQLKHEIAALEALEEIGIYPKEPIQGHCSFDGWPEIEVLGPTYDYYKSLFPKHFDFSQFIDLEKTNLRASKDDDNEEILEEEAFERLDNFERSGLSPTNLNSAIIQITTAQGKFLFSGDAGIESFLQIPDYENKIKDIHFFKVPHHGSANNLNSKLIQLMNPDIAFISGDSHVSNKVVSALKRQKSKVFITKFTGQTLIYPLE
jgi:beta-lactamase superfamily II metal-dependent hydrolase